MPSSVNVPVGPSTIAGWSSTITGLVLAVIALTTGDHTQQTVGAVVGGTLAVVSFAVTQVGRYAQAHALAKRTPGSLLIPGDVAIREAASLAAREAVERTLQSVPGPRAVEAKTPEPDAAWTGPEAPTTTDDDDPDFVPPEDGELDLDDPHLDEPGYGDAHIAGGVPREAHVRLYDEADGERIAAARGASA